MILQVTGNVGWWTAQDRSKRFCVKIIDARKTMDTKLGVHVIVYVCLSFFSTLAFSILFGCWCSWQWNLIVISRGVDFPVCTCFFLADSWAKDESVTSYYRFTIMSSLTDLVSFFLSLSLSLSLYIHIHNVYICIYIYTYIHTYIHTDRHTYIHLRIICYLDLPKNVGYPASVWPSYCPRRLPKGLSVAGCPGPDSCSWSVAAKCCAQNLQPILAPGSISPGSKRGISEANQLYTYIHIEMYISRYIYTYRDVYIYIYIDR